MTKVNAVAVLDTIATTLVVQDRYATKDLAIRALAQTAVRTKINSYQRRIRRLQGKYGMDFAAFSKTVEGSASPQQENDWFSWRSALSMLDEWQTVYQGLTDEPTHY